MLTLHIRSALWVVQTHALQEFTRAHQVKPLLLFAHKLTATFIEDEVNSELRFAYLHRFAIRIAFLRSGTNTCGTHTQGVDVADSSSLLTLHEVSFCRDKIIFRKT